MIEITMMVKNPDEGRYVLKVYSSVLDGGLLIESEDLENVQCKFRLNAESIKQLCDFLQKDLIDIP